MPIHATMYPALTAMIHFCYVGCSQQAAYNVDQALTLQIQSIYSSGRPAEWSVVSGVVGAACIGGAGIAQGKAAGNVVNASSTILHATPYSSAETSVKC